MVVNCDNFLFCSFRSSVMQRRIVHEACAGPQVHLCIPFLTSMFIHIRVQISENREMNMLAKALNIDKSCLYR